MYLSSLLAIIWLLHFTLGAPTEEPSPSNAAAPQIASAWFGYPKYHDVPVYNGTLPNGYYYRNYTDQCLLWDKTCGGSRPLALQNFFNQSGSLWQFTHGDCEFAERALGPLCKSWLATPPVSSSIKSWMREPECRSSFAEWHGAYPEAPWTWSSWNEVLQNLQTTSVDWDRYTRTSTLGCCDDCRVFGGNIDLFHWPVFGANSDCVSEIGTSERPINDDLFTTDDWGYLHLASRPNPYATDSNGRGPPLGTTSSSASGPPRSRLRYHSLAESCLSHSVAVNSSMTTNETIPGRTAVVSGHTFTFPTIYVGFSQLEARDGCGTIDDDINYTILPFQPGELSTLQVPNWQRWNIPASLTKSFNFADLPCPPRDVMIAIEYKPEPGMPYRPVLAPPQKLKNLRPGWANCDIGGWFQGIDPPMALSAGPTALVKPSRRILIGVPTASPQPGSSPLNSQPSATPRPTRIGSQDTGIPSPQPQDHEQPVTKAKNAPARADPSDPGRVDDNRPSDSKQAPNRGQTVGEEAKESEHHDDNFDSSIVSPERVSAIKNAPKSFASLDSHQTSGTEDGKDAVQQTDPGSAHIEEYSSGKPDQMSSKTQEAEEGNQFSGALDPLPTNENRPSKHSIPPENPKTKPSPSDLKHPVANHAKANAIGESETLIHTLSSAAPTNSTDQALPGISPSINHPENNFKHTSQPPPQLPQISVIPPSPSIISTNPPQPNLSPWILTSANEIIYFSTPANGEESAHPIASTKTILPGLPASIGSAGDVIYYSLGTRPSSPASDGITPTVEAPVETSRANGTGTSGSSVGETRGTGAAVAPYDPASGAAGRAADGKGEVVVMFAVIFLAVATVVAVFAF